LNRRYYDKELLPLLADWLMVFLGSKGVKGIPDHHLRAYLLHAAQGPSDAVASVRRELGGEYLKLLNLSHDWLVCYLPFVLGKIDRVSFGLLSGEDLRRALASDPLMAKSRQLLAVPFVGKDVPSESSEFSHPDIVLGLTILGYRYEGLRRKDLIQVLRMLMEMCVEQSGTFQTRPSCQLYSKWINLAGGRVRGWKRSEKRKTQQTGSGESTSARRGSVDEKKERWIEKNERKVESLPVGAQNALKLIQDYGLMSDLWDLWPLQLLDIKDTEQMDVLYALLHKLPEIVYFWVNSEVVFPETSRHQALKLVANGQALGGDMLFRRRIGFSGTPSDLLPVELGTCQYEAGADGQMLAFLTSPSVCSWERLPSDWSPQSILMQIAKKDNPPYHALIDTGALITGMDNLAVARFLWRTDCPR